MADYYSYNQSLESQKQEYIFESRQYVGVPDNNGGFYANQIKFDCAQISNSEKLTDWSQSYMQVPLVPQLGPFDTEDAAEAAFAVTMKNHIHLIDSMDINIGTYNCANLTAMSHLDINYKILSEWDINALKTFGPSCGYYLNNPRSINHYGTNNVIGNGEVNNIPIGGVFDPARVYQSQHYNKCNDARVDRMNDTSFNVMSTSPYLLTTSSSRLGASGKNYCEVVSSGGKFYLTYYVLATIPLRMMHDVFAKLPLIRGSYLSLTVNVNCNAKATLNFTNGGASPCLYSGYTINNPGHGVFPLQIAPIGDGMFAPGVASLTLSCDIGKGSQTGAGHPTSTQCMLYVCQYVLAPALQEEYFLQNAVKNVVHEDRHYSTILNIKPGQNIDSVINQNVSRIKSVLLIPMLSTSVHGGATITGTTPSAGTLGSVMSSPFSSAPSTTCPFVNIQQFNIALSGVTHYQQNINYNWQQFLWEARSQSINGGLTENISSSLLSEVDFYAGYNFLYVDLSRKSSAGVDNVGKSVRVMGVNNSDVTLDFHCIIIYHRELNVNCSTGAMLFNV